MILAFHIGTRLKKDAFVMVDKLLRKLENMPLFISDGLQYYKLALLKELGVSKKEASPNSRRHRYSVRKTEPPEDLRYGQLIKTVEGGKPLNVERRVVFGEVDEKDITTSVVERLNLTLRQEMNRFSRKTIGASKSISHLGAHFAFYARYYNLCRPHMSHKISGIKYGTPAMAAGITDDVWSIRKLMFFPYRNYINYLQLH
jgi:hypothetical protein